MAFLSKNLSVLAYANGFTLWHYKTEDAATDVDDLGYFDKAQEMLNVGDIILTNTDTDGTPASGMIQVSSVTQRNIDVSDMTPFGDNNSD